MLLKVLTRIFPLAAEREQVVLIRRDVVERHRFLGLHRAQELGEVLFDRRKVHLVQTQEERRVLEMIGTEEELDERRLLVAARIHRIPEPQQVRRVVPVRADLQHEVVAREFSNVSAPC